MSGSIPIRIKNPRKDLRGTRFGKLIVEKWAGDSRWLCLCDCGNRSKVLTANLKRGNTGSCGCIRNIKASKRATTHGLSHTRAYKSWLSIRRRCRDPNYGAYKDYGAKGIDVCEEWAVSAQAFMGYIGAAPSDNHTVDRIDNSKGYEPGNVRWATPMEQGCNKTNNRIVTYQGETYTLSQLARKIAAECGILPDDMARAFERVLYRKKKIAEGDLRQEALDCE